MFSFAAAADDARHYCASNTCSNHRLFFPTSADSAEVQLGSGPTISVPVRCIDYVSKLQRITRDNTSWRNLNHILLVS